MDNLIVSELIRVSRIDVKPRPEDGCQPGWGIPGIILFGNSKISEIYIIYCVNFYFCSGSPYDNIHFRSSIIETFSVLGKRFH